MAYFRNLMAMIRRPYYGNVPLFPSGQDLSWIPDGGTNIATELPAETPDGETATFTFTSVPKFLVLNGQVLKQTTDFTVVGLTATLSTPPATGAELYGIV